MTNQRTADEHDTIGDPLQSANYFGQYDALVAVCRNNVHYFRADDTEMGQRFYCAFNGLMEHIEIARSHAEQIRSFAAEYDFDANTPGNGYRSFLLVVNACIAHSLRLSTTVTANRASMLFRRSLYMK